MEFVKNPFVFQGEDSLYKFSKILSFGKYSDLILLVDENTEKYCLPLFLNVITPTKILKISSGEGNKNMESCQCLWTRLAEMNVDRKALLMNLGGGVLCDIGGFVAATFKRGIDFVNIPTTLMAMSDAAIGGKTGVDLGSVKNMIGVYKNPIVIVIYQDFLKTLDERQILSGFAEIIKHAIIAERTSFEKIYFNTDLKENLEDSIFRSVKVKKRITSNDFYEQDERKALNFGHSIGHALESFFLKNHPDNYVLHGEAVAAGMVIESWIAFKQNILNEKDFNAILYVLRKYYSKLKFLENDFSEIIAYLMNDKKNEKGHFLFALPPKIGHCNINCVVTKKEIARGLLFYFNNY